MTDLNKLSPAALKAAMRGDTVGWGSFSCAKLHVRYMEPIQPRSRSRCSCGCKKRATHMGMAKGIVLATGCEFAIAKWVSSGALPLTPATRKRIDELIWRAAGEG